MGRLTTVVAVMATAFLGLSEAVDAQPTPNSVTGSASVVLLPPAFPPAVTTFAWEFDATGTAEPGGAATGTVKWGCFNCATSSGFGVRGDVTCLNVSGNRAVIGALTPGGRYYDGRSVRAVYVVDDNGPPDADGTLVDTVRYWYDEAWLSVPPPPGQQGPYNQPPLTECPMSLADRAAPVDLAGYSGDFTVTGEADAPNQIAQLGLAIRELDLHHRIARRLLAPLRKAQRAARAGDALAACRRMRAFEDRVAALSGRKLSPQTARELLDDAARITRALGCGGG
jgi:hypothetical protein